MTTRAELSSIATGLAELAGRISALAETLANPQPDGNAGTAGADRARRVADEADETVGRTGQRVSAGDREVLGHELFEVERGLRAAQRRLGRLLER